MALITSSLFVQPITIALILSSHRTAFPTTPVLVCQCGHTWGTECLCMFFFIFDLCALWSWPSFWTLSCDPNTLVQAFQWWTKSEYLFPFWDSFYDPLWVNNYHQLCSCQLHPQLWHRGCLTNPRKHCARNEHPLGSSPFCIFLPYSIPPCCHLPRIMLFMWLYILEPISYHILPAGLIRFSSLCFGIVLSRSCICGYTWGLLNEALTWAT